MMLNTGGQHGPDGKRHVFAVNLRHLLSLNQVAQTKHCDSPHQIGNAYLTSCVFHIALRITRWIACNARNRAAHTQNHNFFVLHEKIVEKTCNCPKAG